MIFISVTRAYMVGMPSYSAYPSARFMFSIAKRQSVMKGKGGGGIWKHLRKHCVLAPLLRLSIVAQLPRVSVNRKQETNKRKQPAQHGNHPQYTYMTTRLPDPSTANPPISTPCSLWMFLTMGGSPTTLTSFSPA